MNQTLHARYKADLTYRLRWKESIKRRDSSAAANATRISNAKRKGVHHCEEAKLKIALKAKERKGTLHSQFGMKWVSLNGDARKVRDVELFLKNGWSLGRKSL